MRRTLAVVTIFGAIGMAACSRGGRSTGWTQEQVAQTEPMPGSGQTGPGMAAYLNRINGPGASAFAYTDRSNGVPRYTVTQPGTGLPLPVGK